MSYNIEQVNSGYMSFNSGGLAAGTNAGTFQIATAINYTNNGVFRQRAALNNIAFSSGHTALGNSQACLFGVWLDNSGNVTTSQGPIVEAGQPCPVPPSPAGVDRTLAGLIKVTTGAAQTFTPGTSTLGTGNTAAYHNCSVMPGSAQ